MTLAAVGSSVSAEFVPIPDRPIRFDRWGGGTGTAQVMSSTDGGVTKLPITIGGTPWATFTGDCGDEEVCTPTQYGRTYFVVFTGIAGTVNWGLYQ